MKLLELFQDWKEMEEYSARTTIFSERESADAMYIVISGEVELTLLNEPLGIESAGGMVGEMAMLAPAGTRSASAKTLTKVKLARLNRDQFRSLVDENTDFALHVMTKLASRLIVANNYIAQNFN